MLAIKFYWNFLRMARFVFIHIFSYYSWILIQFIHAKWKKVQKVTVLRKVALHLFVKKKQKWDKNLVEHHVRGWWLRAMDGA